MAVADALIANSGRERTSMFCYANGWTQHSEAVQMIRSAAILQLLLGNVGRPGGGIMAMRGHASIQGSTDIPTLYDLLPGYLHMPRTREGHLTLEEYIGVARPIAAGGHISMPTSSRCSRRGSARRRRRRTITASVGCRS